MTPETKEKYLKAVTELFSTLSHEAYTPIDEIDFCVRHGLKPSFFLALRDLDALQYDVIGQAGYKQTPKLATLDPEEILNQMKASARKQNKANDAAEDVPEPERQTESKRPQTEPKPEPTPEPGPEPIPQPEQLTMGLDGLTIDLLPRLTAHLSGDNLRLRLTIGGAFLSIDADNVHVSVIPTPDQ